MALSFCGYAPYTIKSFISSLCKSMISLQSVKNCVGVSMKRQAAIAMASHVFNTGCTLAGARSHMRPSFRPRECRFWEGRAAHFRAISDLFIDYWYFCNI